MVRRKATPESRETKVMTAIRSMYLPLVVGGESEERINLLLSLTRFNEATKKALAAIYVKGWNVQLTSYTFDILENNLIRSIARLDEVNQTVHRLKHIS